MSSDSTGSNKWDSQTVKDYARQRTNQEPEQNEVLSLGKHCLSSEGQRVEEAMESLSEIVLYHAGAMNDYKDILKYNGDLVKVIKHHVELTHKEIKEIQGLTNALKAMKARNSQLRSLNPHDPVLVGYSKERFMSLKEAIRENTEEKKGFMEFFRTIRLRSTKVLVETMEFLQEAERQHADAVGDLRVSLAQ